MNGERSREKFHGENYGVDDDDENGGPEEREREKERTKEK